MIALSHVSLITACITILQYYREDGNGGLGQELTDLVRMDFDEGNVDTQKVFLVSTVPVTCNFGQCKLQIGLRSSRVAAGQQQNLVCQYRYTYPILITVQIH